MLAGMHLAPQETRTYFLTFVCAQRWRLFQVERNAELMLSVLQMQREVGRMQVHAFVLMPDHVHLLLTPAPEVSLEKSVQFVKGGFSFCSRASWMFGSGLQRDAGAECEGILFDADLHRGKSGASAFV